MDRTRRCGLAILAVATAGTLGCGPKVTMEMVKQEMMKDVPRPAELDHLNAFVGTWDSSGEMTIPGVEGSLKFTGTSTAQWDVAKRCVVERFEGTMEGKSFQGMGLYWWDGHEKEFHTLWIDSMGAAHHGEMTYNAGTKTWKMEGKGHDQMSGQTVWGYGTITMPDDNTMNSTYKQKDMWAAP